MKKKIIIAVSFVLVLAIVFVTLIFYDRSGLIIQAYNEYGYTVTEKILEETTLNYYLSDLSDKQLEQAADYKIVYFLRTAAARKNLLPGQYRFVAVTAPGGLKVTTLLLAFPG